MMYTPVLPSLFLRDEVVQKNNNSRRGDSQEREKICNSRSPFYEPEFTIFRGPYFNPFFDHIYEPQF